MKYDGWMDDDIHVDHLEMQRCKEEKVKKILTDENS